MLLRYIWDLINLDQFDSFNKFNLILFCSEFFLFRYCKQNFKGRRGECNFKRGLQRTVDIQCFQQASFERHI